MYKSILPALQSNDNIVMENTSLENAPISTTDHYVLQNADKRYLRFLYDMWSILKQPRINLGQLNTVMATYDAMQQDYKEEYLQVLFNPEKQANAKIPSLFPVPSSSFLSHQQISVSTNASGNIAFVWNPVYLQDAGVATQSTLFVNNDIGLTGSSSSNFFLAADLGYAQLPANLYSQYRVVGASICVTYTGRMDIVSGIIGMGIGLNQFAAPNVIGQADPSSAIFGNFNLIDDLYFAKKTNSINGCRAIYFPLDNRFLQFNAKATSAVGSGSVNGFYFGFYGANLPSSSNCLRIDVYIQYECTVQPQFNGYLTQSPGQYSKKNWLEETSQIIYKNPDIVTQTTSEAPKGVTAAAASGFMDFIQKLLGGGSGKALLNSVGEAVKSIPGIGSILGLITDGFGITGNK